ncbi:MAG: YtxH domain-containing protein [Anaerolineales bacterium]|nr:MAG: YtxH domain-containing protein [Anaerolineales bacterium]
MRKAFSFLVGIAAGAVVGAVTAMLLAPESGAELQQRIRQRAASLMEEGKRAADLRRSELETQLEAFKRGTPITIDATDRSQA